MLSNSFQNVTAEAPITNPGAISHKAFSQAVTLLKKEGVIFTDGQQLTMQENPICFHTTSVPLVGALLSQHSSTPVLSC